MADQEFQTVLTARDETAGAINAAIKNLQKLQAAQFGASGLGAGAKAADDFAKNINKTHREASQFQRLMGDMFPAISRQISGSSSALAGMAARYFSAAIAAKELASSLTKFVESDKQMRLLASATGKTVESTKELENAFRKLANEAGRSTDEVVSGFNVFRTRSGLAYDAALRLYPLVVKGSTLAKTSIEDLSTSMGVVVANLDITEEQFPRVMDIMMKGQQKYNLQLDNMMRSLPQLSEELARWGYTGEQAFATMITLIGTTQPAFRNSERAARSLYTMLQEFGNQKFLDAAQLSADGFRISLEQARESGKGALIQFMEFVDQAIARAPDLKPLDAISTFFSKDVALAVGKMWEVWHRIPQEIRESAQATGAFQEALNKVTGDAPWVRVQKLANEYDHLKQAVGGVMDAAGATAGMERTAQTLDRIARKLDELTKNPLIKMMLAANRMISTGLDYVNPFNWPDLVTPDVGELQKRAFPGIYGPATGKPLFPGVQAAPGLEETPHVPAPAAPAAAAPRVTTRRQLSAEQQRLQAEAQSLWGMAQQLHQDITTGAQTVPPAQQAPPPTEVERKTLEEQRGVTGILGDIRELLRKAFPWAGVGGEGGGGGGAGGLTYEGMRNAVYGPGGGLNAAPGQTGGGGGSRINIQGGQQSQTGYYMPGTSTSLGGGLGSNSASLGPGRHGGDDIMMSHGSPVYAVKGGVVEHYGTDNFGGQTMRVRHDDGSKTTYMHLSKRTAPVGARVEGGEAIGNSGTANGVPHLHLEMTNPQGQRISPRQALGIVPPSGGTQVGAAPTSGQGTDQGGGGIQGAASYYNPYRPGYASGGPMTASGERYDPNDWTAAIQTGLRGKFGGVGYGKKYRPAYALVTSPDGKQAIVRINDVGPLARGRVIDLNQRSMQHFDPSMQRGVLPGMKVTPLPLGQEYPVGPLNAPTPRERPAEAPTPVSHAGLDDIEQRVARLREPINISFRHDSAAFIPTIRNVSKRALNNELGNVFSDTMGV